MRTSRSFTSLGRAFLLLLALTGAALAAEPGEPIRDLVGNVAVSDQKPGSILFYNVYTSNATSPAAENTRIAITNTGPSSIGVHLFFVEGSSCSPADSVICLTTNQTAVILASGFDPGTVGYVVAIAVDLATGCPTNYNYLIGDEFVKFASGHAANLAAESVMARGPITCSDTASQVTLNFDGQMYDHLPAVVAIDNIPSRVDGNDTLVIINRPSGNLGVGADALGTIFGILYNDAENSASFQIGASQCQFRFSFSNSVPRTVPRFTNHVGGGHSGWVKLYSLSGTTPLLGASINFNAAADASGTAFSQGHNFHKLRLVPATSIIVPVFPANC
jgi:hypothetical protein